MSIRTKIILIVVALFALSAGVDLTIQRFIIYPSFLQLEQREAAENIRRIISAIDREIFHLDKLCSDWATWNDSYDFIDTLAEDFIQNNLIADTFSTNNVNMLCFFRHDGSVAWGQAYDLEKEEALSFQFLQDRQLPAGHPMITLKEVQPENLSHVRTGVLMTDKGPMLFASRAILRTDASGPSRGILTMGRMVTDTLVSSLNEQTRIDFTINHPLTPETVNQERDRRTTYREGDLIYYAERQDNHINIWTTYTGADGQPAFSIAYLFPRKITEKGITSIRYALFLAVGTALAILVILIIFLQLVVVKPIRQITDHAARLDRDGDYTIQLNFNRRDELGRLARALDFATATIAERTLALTSANQKLEQLSQLDGLTGIANRRRFDDHLQKEWLRAARHKHSLSLIIVDVDHFKQYNDRYGHQKGDQCLVAIASTMNRLVTRSSDLVARYGGEEFAVILPETDAGGALKVAEKIRRVIYDLQILHEGSQTASVVTLSLGINHGIPSSSDNMDAFIHNADQALYQSKKSGRNKSTLFK